MIKAHASVVCSLGRTGKAMVVGSATCGCREEVAMSVPRADDQGRRSPGESLEVPREELLARARPLPPHEDMVIGELTDEEAAAFWAAITQA
jgi:hypothetical protein